MLRNFSAITVSSSLVKSGFGSRSGWPGGNTFACQTPLAPV
jgi:hypothetical protein